MISLPPDDLIFVVDDSEADLMIVEMVLSMSELANPVELFPDGESVLARMREIDSTGAPPPALLILDVNMPRVTGFDVLGEVRGHPSFQEVPVVIMLSSSDADKDRARAAELGADDYIVKATGIEEYVRTFNETFVNMPTAA